jgi:hypothetical protein
MGNNTHNINISSINEVQSPLGLCVYLSLGFFLKI